MESPAYKRVLVKISGEALAGPQGTGIDFSVMRNICSVVKKCADAGVEVAVVVGAGNFWRGIKNGAGKFDRARADHMGMLATTMNAIALSDQLEQLGLEAHVLTAMDVSAFAEHYAPDRARRLLSGGSAVILGGGTGNPYVSTDTGAILRALELHADIALLAKNIDGVYDSDPAKNPDAKKFDTLPLSQVVERRLGVIDMTAACMASENRMPVLLFGLDDPENIYRAAMGESVGTVLTTD